MNTLTLPGPWKEGLAAVCTMRGVKGVYGRSSFNAPGFCLMPSCVVCSLQWVGVSAVVHGMLDQALLDPVEEMLLPET